MTPELRDRLGKLLRLLCGGGPDGEVLAAANRISATVEAHSLDWDAMLGGPNGHDLSREQMAEIYEAGVRAGIEQERNAKDGDWATAGRSRADEISDRESELREILTAAAQSRADGLLEDWYANFSRDMQERLDRWGSRTFVTERQWEFLGKLRSILERQDYL